MILTSSKTHTLRSHFKYLKIRGIIEAKRSLIIIENFRRLDVRIVVVDRQLLISYGNAGDKLEFTLQKDIRLLSVFFSRSYPRPSAGR